MVPPARSPIYPKPELRRPVWREVYARRSLSPRTEPCIDRRMINRALLFGLRQPKAACPPCSQSALYDETTTPFHGQAT